MFWTWCSKSLWFELSQTYLWPHPRNLCKQLTDCVYTQWKCFNWELQQQDNKKYTHLRATDRKRKTRLSVVTAAQGTSSKGRSHVLPLERLNFFESQCCCNPQLARCVWLCCVHHAHSPCEHDAQNPYEFVKCFEHNYRIPMSRKAFWTRCLCYRVFWTWCSKYVWIRMM